MLEFLSYEKLTLKNQTVESSLLYDCRDSNIRHTEEKKVVIEGEDFCEDVFDAFVH